MHYTLHESYKPLIQSLPLSLAYLSYGSAEEKGHDNSQIGESPRASQDVDPDLRDRNRPSSSFASRTSSPDKPLVTEKSSMQQRESQSTNDTRPSHAPKGSITGIPTAPGPPLTTASPVNPPRFGPTGGDQSPNGVELAPAIRLREEVAIAEGDAGKAEEQEAAQYFAVPGGPGIQRRVEMDGNDPDAFFHPATKEPQRILWLPKDELGLCAAEIEENGRVGVWASSRNAWLTHKVSTGSSDLADPSGQSADLERAARRPVVRGYTDHVSIRSVMSLHDDDGDDGMHTFRCGKHWAPPVQIWRDPGVFAVVLSGAARHLPARHRRPGVMRQLSIRPSPATAVSHVLLVGSISFLSSTQRPCKELQDDAPCSTIRCEQVPQRGPARSRQRNMVSRRLALRRLVLQLSQRDLDLLV